VTGILALVARREHQLGGPRVAQPLPVAYEHVEDRDLVAFPGFGVVVAVVGVVLRGEQAQASPAALVGEGPDPLGIGLRDNGEAEPLAEVASGTIERVEDRRARSRSRASARARDRTGPRSIPATRAC
jgi:hypothetical protein